MCTHDTIQLSQTNFRNTAAALAAMLATLALNHQAASAQSPAPRPVSEARGGDAVRQTVIDRSAFQDPTRVQLESLNERDLKTLYRTCSREAIDRHLGSGEIAYCSIAYEVLMNKHFAGDFGALLAWSRANRD
jgi:hypothetical protein